MSYLIKNNTVIATSTVEFKAGACEFSLDSTKEAINANFEKSLVNAKSGKISNAKKWAKEAAQCMSSFDLVDKYFEREFLVR